MNTLERPEQQVAWELRGLWARRERPMVVLALSERCMVGTVTGQIEYVAVTGAYVVVDGWHIPTVDILGVMTQHFSQRSKTRLRSA